jgi:hypothetical protein
METMSKYIENYISRSLDIYSDLTKKTNYDQSMHTNKACCLYALGRYKEAYDEAKKGVESELNVIKSNLDPSKVSLRL